MVELLFNIGSDPGLKLGLVLDLGFWRGVLRVMLCIILLLKFFFLHLRKRVVSC